MKAGRSDLCADRGRSAHLIMGPAALVSVVGVVPLVAQFFSEYIDLDHEGTQEFLPVEPVRGAIRPTGIAVGIEELDQDESLDSRLSRPERVNLQTPQDIGDRNTGLPAG